MQEVADPAAADNLMNTRGLHRGESEAVALAVLMDDRAGVDLARRFGVSVLRTPGIYRLAADRRHIDAVRPKLDALRREGFRLKEEHYRAILDVAGES